MYHSITIGDKNTWDDWHLIPMTRPLVAPPPIATNYAEIPGLDGFIDLSTALTGAYTYGKRSGSWQFALAQSDTENYGDWATRYSAILAYLRGGAKRVVLEDDPSYFYEGNVYVSDFRSDKWYSLIELTYDLSPFKRSFTSTVDEWIWDTFNFETDQIPTNFNDMYVNGTLTKEITGTYMRCIPEITVSAPMTITYNGNTVTFEQAGTYRTYQLMIVEGTLPITFEGVGRVTLVYRGGIL